MIELKKYGQLIKFLENHDGFRPVEIAERIRINSGTVDGYLAILTKQKMLFREGKPKAIYYFKTSSWSVEKALEVIRTATKEQALKMKRGDKLDSSQ